MTGAEYLNGFLVLFALVTIFGQIFKRRSPSRETPKQVKMYKVDPKQGNLAQKPLQIPAKPPKKFEGEREQATFVNPEPQFEAHPAFLDKPDYSEFDTPAHLRKKKADAEKTQSDDPVTTEEEKSESEAEKPSGSKTPDFVKETRSRRQGKSFNEID